MNKPALQTMQHWIDRGWLTPLNRAFARFLWDRDETANEVLLWAGALVSHQLDRGEVYLDLEKLCRHPGLTLAIPSDAAWMSQSETANQALSILRRHHLNDWLEALSRSPLVASTEDNTPLVLADNRLYLRRYWHYQQILDQRISQRLQATRLSLPSDFSATLNALFETNAASPDWQKIACVLALRSRFTLITGGPGTGKTTTLTKLLALLIQLTHLESPDAKPLNILLAAPTGKAAARVSESIAKAVNTLNVDDAIKRHIPKQAGTLHRLLGSRQDTRQFRHHRHNPIVADIVIIDEASMIDLEMMAALLEALTDQCQLILLGDKDQLASVEAGSVMGDLCRGATDAAYDAATLDWLKQYADIDLAPPPQAGSAINQQTVMLRYSHRFNEFSGIGQLAKAVNAADATLAQSILNDTDSYLDLLPKPQAAYRALRASPSPEAANALLKKLVTIDAGFDPQGKSNPHQGYAHYLHIIQNHRPTTVTAYDDWAKQILTAFDTFQVLCALRQSDWGVEGLNRRIESWLFPHQLPSLWYEGRPVMITRNDYNLGLMNGDIGIALNDHSGKLRVAFPSDDPLAELKIRWLSPVRLPDVETAYAITVHKSQGSEFNHVALVLPENRSPVISRELIYTGITRAKQHFTLLESGPHVLTQAISSSFSANQTA